MRRRSGPTPRARDAARSSAQELAWEAMNARAQGDVERMCAMCLKAIEVHEACLDAHLMLIRHSEITLDERIEGQMALLGVGVEDLGMRFLDEHAGHLWDELECRPLLRVMSSLAADLVATRCAAGYDSAIGIGVELLRLDHDDHLGMRTVLGPLYLARRRFEDAQALLERFKDCTLLSLGWTRVMLAFATDGERAAARLLGAVIAANEFAPALVSGKRRNPGRVINSYTLGSEDEALMAVDCLAPALRAMPAFRKWLRQAGPGPAR